MAKSAEPETYLRLTCERLLLNEGRGNGAPEGAEAAVVGRALMAAGILDEAVARSVLAEYSLAMGLRNNRGPWRIRRMFSGPIKGKQLTARRIALCQIAFADAPENRTLERVLFADDTTHIDLSGIYAPGQGAPSMVQMRHRNMMRRPGGPHPHGLVLTVTDDQGTRATAHPGSSGSNDRHWHATFNTDAPLSPETRWVEIDGERFELPERMPPPAVYVEPIEVLEPIRSMFYQEILGTGHRHGGQGMVEVAIEALLATVALNEDDPLVDEIRRIAGAFQSGTATPKLPEPWASLMRRFSKSDGPKGSVPIGAAIDSVDGYSIRYDSLTSDETSFSLSVAVSPGFPLIMRFPGFDLERSPLDWWAEDDLGNVYLGVNGGGGGSGEMAEGSVASLSPLDPKATELRLLPTGSTERGVVTISLASLRDHP